MILKGLVVLVALIAISFIAGYFWVKSYLRSEEFRAELSRQVGSAVGGQAQFSELDWEGSRMGTETVAIQSKSSGNWELERVDADLDLAGLWERVWRVPSIEMASARVDWDQRTSAEEKSTSSQTASQKSSTAKNQKKSNNGWLPNRTELLALTIQRFEGEVLTEGGSYQWERMHLEYKPGASAAESLITLRRGRLETPMTWLGRLKLGEAKLRTKAGRVNLVSSDWTLKERAQLDLTGHWEDGSWLLEGEAKDLTFGELLPLAWQRSVSGQVQGDFVVESSPTGEPIVNGSVTVEDGAIGSLPLLDRLAAYAGNASLRRLTLEEASADYRWESEGWQLTNLILSDEGLVRVEGRLRAQGDALDGQLRVGVPPGLLAHIPGAEEKVFLAGEKNLLWTSVKVSGTIHNPKEDLSARMIRAAGERMFELIPETAEWALKFGGQAMDQGTAAILQNQGLILEEGEKAAEEVLKQGGDAVEEGVKTGFGILEGIFGQ